jgi:hypothetical protein
LLPTSNIYPNHQQPPITPIATSRQFSLPTTRPTVIPAPFLHVLTDAQRELILITMHRVAASP